MQDHRLAAVLALLVVGIVAVPYLLRGSPKSRRDWLWVAAALGFLFWLLAGAHVLRAVA